MADWVDSNVTVEIPDDDSDTAVISNDRTALLPGAESFDVKPKHWLSFEFYQQLFDVDTDTVLSRIRSASVPKKSFSFVDSVLRSRSRAGPDMYGPFWICATLVFSTAICGNLSNFIVNHGSEDYTYSPQFDRVSLELVDFEN